MTDTRRSSLIGSEDSGVMGYDPPKGDPERQRALEAVRNATRATGSYIFEDELADLLLAWSREAERKGERKVGLQMRAIIERAERRGRVAGLREAEAIAGLYSLGIWAAIAIQSRADTLEAEGKG